MVLVVMNSAAVAGDQGDTSSIPGAGDPLEEEMATQCSLLDWRILGTEKPGGLQSLGS